MRILFINRVMGLWRGGGENFDLNLAYSLKIGKRLNLVYFEIKNYWKMLKKI